MDVYKNVRIKKQENVFNILERHGMLPFLRGSWKTGEFHFNLYENISLSDIDIIVDGISGKDAIEITRSITKETSIFFDIPIQSSIHPQDSLGKMSVYDSKILSIGEYISKYRQYASMEDMQIEYFRVKIIFLLLRISRKESYIDTVNRIGTSEVKNALQVKLGEKKIFPLDSAEKLIRSENDDMALIFLNNCLLKNPDDIFTEYIVEKIKDAKTIDKWLCQYIIEKIYRYS